MSIDVVNCDLNIFVTNAQSPDIFVKNTQPPDIIISVTPGEPGAGVAAGGTAGQVLTKIDGADYNTQWVDAFLNWTDLVATWDIAPTLIKAIAGGAVYNYTRNGVTRYRFVPDPYSSVNDSFFSGFDPNTDLLSGLLVSRGF